jgi:hypothetical protein
VNLSENAIRLLVAAARGQGRFANRFAVHYRPDFVRANEVQLHGTEALRVVDELKNAGLAIPENDLWRLTAQGIAIAEFHGAKKGPPSKADEIASRLIELVEKLIAEGVIPLDRADRAREIARSMAQT